MSPDKVMSYFIIMENCVSQEMVHELYDLKGSTINRSVPQHLRAILVGQYTKARLLKQIEEDTKFLSLHNILDYSLLVGIHFGDNIDNGSEEDDVCIKKSYSSIFQANWGGIRTNLQPEVYFFVGIIDILTQWDVSKKGEYGYKTLVLAQDKTQLSAISPKKYHQRFMEYLAKIVI